MPFVGPGDSVGGHIPAGGRGAAGGFVFPQGPVTPAAPMVFPGTINATVNTPVTFQISAVGGPFVPNGFTVTPALPAGLTLNQNTGQITGTPTTAQTVQTYQMTAENSVGVSAPATLSITIAVPAPVVSAGTITGVPGTAITLFQIVATNSPTSYGVTAALPTGLALNTTNGQITGTSAVAVNTTRTITATNSGGTGSATLTINIAVPLSAPVITSSNSANATEGSAFSYTITASGNPAVVATGFNATGLPAWLSRSGAVISGTPPAGSSPGPATFTVTATNSQGTSPGVLVSVAIGTPLPVAPTITSPATAIANEGTLFTYTITASGTPAPTLGATGLPAWLSFTAPNTVSGTPAAGSAGTPTTFTVTAANGTLPNASQLVTVTIMAGWELTLTYPAQPTMSSSDSRRALSTWTGYAANQAAVDAVMTDDLYNLVPDQASMPVRFYATYPGQPELEIPFDNWTTPPVTGNAIRNWGYWAGAPLPHSVYVVGVNGTGGPLQFRLVHD